MRIRIVDAFTDRPFAGNPAGVCLLEVWPDEPWMRAVAAELNLSETAFAVARPNGDWDLRWFTPAGTEVDLCGHGTLATAHVLDRDEVRFHTRSGVLTARGGDEIRLDFPASPPAPTEAPDGLGAALGAEPVEVLWVPALRELLAVFDDARTVRELAPYWAQRLGRDRLVGYQASARGGSVRTHLRGDRVELSGRAVTVLDGELLA